MKSFWWFWDIILVWVGGWVGVGRGLKRNGKWSLSVKLVRSIYCIEIKTFFVRLRFLLLHVCWQVINLNLWCANEVSFKILLLYVFLDMQRLVNKVQFWYLHLTIRQSLRCISIHFQPRRVQFDSCTEHLK